MFIFKDVKSYVEEQKALVSRKMAFLKKKPQLAVIQLGNDPASNSYIRGKQRDCEEVGIKFVHLHCDFEKYTTGEIKRLVDKTCRDKANTGVMVQLPIPSYLDLDEIKSAIWLSKDVDSMRIESRFNPCTPRGIIDYLDYCEYDLAGKEALVIGRSDIVGKPLARMLLDRDATVTIVHSHSFNLKEHIANSDMIFTAINKIEYFTADYFENFYGDGIIDIGLGRNSEGKLKGNLADDAKAMTQCFGGGSPNYHIISGTGGVGLLTRLALLKNIYDAAKGNSYVW